MSSPAPYPAPAVRAAATIPRSIPFYCDACALTIMGEGGAAARLVSDAGRLPRRRTLRAHAHPADGDPLTRNLKHDASAGLLAIDPRRRRRMRVNGSGRWITADELEVRTEEVYANCPEYIRRREPDLARSSWRRAIPTAAAMPPPGRRARLRAPERGSRRRRSSHGAGLSREQHVQHAGESAGGAAGGTPLSGFRAWWRTPAHRPGRAEVERSRTRASVLRGGGAGVTRRARPPVARPLAPAQRPVGSRARPPSGRPPPWQDSSPRDSPSSGPCP